MTWQDKKEVIKGNIGEEIIVDFLEKKDFIVYKPITKNKPHWIDIFATKNKKDIYAIDVKTKARFNKWAAQGINYNHYLDYKNLLETTNINVYLFFIDDKNGDVHCAELSKLRNPFYVLDRTIIAWSLQQMKLIHTLDREQINELSKYDNRNYEYKLNK